MRKTILIAALMLPTITAAQTQPTEYVLKVTPQELDVISEGLQSQPFKLVVPIINKLREQVIKQQTPAVVTPAVPEKPKE